MSNTNILTPNPGTQSSNANSSGFNILIVDDEEYIVDFLREALNFWGYATQVATKVADALEILKSSKINLLLTDKNIESEDSGLELALQAKKIAPEIMIFLITGNFVDDETLKFCEKNSITFLQKPIRSNELKILITNTYNNYQREIELKSDINAAKKIIEGALPKSLPVYDGIEFYGVYKPVFDIGGDFYDFVKLNSNECVFYLCDVQGHGIQAALFANTIRTFFKVFAESTSNLSELAYKLNNCMCAETHSNSMATGIFLRFNALTSEVNYVNAGHEYPLYYDSATGEISEIASTGTILAIFENSNYEDKTLKLKPGDILMVYTDGVCDNYGINNKTFSIEKIKEIFKKFHNESAEFISLKIFSEIHKQLGGNPQQDDLAFLMVKKQK